MDNKQVSKSMFWKMLERGGYLGCQFVIQIVMARILDPEDYGILSIMTVFVSLANVFVQTGLTSAIIQAKKIDEDQISSVFWVNLIISTVLAVLFYFFAPIIENYYGFKDFVRPFRVLLIVLPIAANSAVQLSMLSRELNFRPIAAGSLLGVLFGGAVGIIMAKNGCKIWALVAQQIVFYFVNSAALTVATRWRPRLFLSLSRIKTLVDFGWKILASNIVEVIYNDFVSLVIGKKYTADTLAYYNRGKQYPNLVGSVIKESLQSVLFPAYSKHQDNTKLLKAEMRKFVRISLFLSSFLLATLAASAESLVKLMLTDKWLPCVPYLKIACIYFAVLPMNTVTLQGVTAIGRSDIYFRLSVWKRVIALGLIICSVILSDSVISIAIVWMLTQFVNVIANYGQIKKLFGYILSEQINDSLPYLFVACVTFFVQYLISFLSIHEIVIIIVQLVAGGLLYIGMNIAFKMPGFKETVSFAKSFIKKAK